MSVRYIYVKRRNPRDPQAPQKYYLQQKAVGHVDREFLIADMVRNTTLTKNEATSGLDYLFDTIPRLLSLGHTVQMGKLGFFKVVIKSHGAATVEDASPSLLKRLRLIFIPGKEVRYEISRLGIEKHPDLEQ